MYTHFCLDVSTVATKRVGNVGTETFGVYGIFLLYVYLEQTRNA